MLKESNSIKGYSVFELLESVTKKIANLQNFRVAIQLQFSNSRTFVEFIGDSNFKKFGKIVNIQEVSTFFLTVH